MPKVTKSKNEEKPALEIDGRSIATTLVINVTEAQKDESEYNKIMDFIFRENFGVHCVIRKFNPDLRFTYVDRDLPKDSYYSLHFFEGSDATFFKLTYPYCLVEGLKEFDTWNRN